MRRPTLAALRRILFDALVYIVTGLFLGAAIVALWVL